MQRKILVQELKEARINYRAANLKGNTLIIDGITYTREEIKSKKHLINSEYYSPPKPRLTVSKPATPISPKPTDEAEEVVEEKAEELDSQLDREQRKDFSRQEENKEEYRNKIEETPGKRTGAIAKKVTTTITSF